MITPDPFLTREIPVIQKIVADETWLEGERRGCSVHPDDVVVRERVCEVVLRIGEQLRQSLASTTDSATPGGELPVSVTNAEPPRTRE